MKTFEAFLLEQDDSDVKNAFAPVVHLIGDSRMDKRKKDAFTKEAWDLMNKLLRELRK